MSAQGSAGDFGLVAAVNYNHWGAPKRWYGVPSAAAPAFEDAFKAALPEQFERHPDLLFHLTAMLPPHTLLNHNVPVFAVLQARSIDTQNWKLARPFMRV
jgi:hypothetical protein